MTDQERLYQGLLAENAYYKRKVARNRIYDMVERFKGRYIILIGGSGSGKSYEFADRCLDRLEQEPKSRILGVRAQRNQVSESQYPLLKSRAGMEYRDGFSTKDAKGLEEVEHRTGGKVLFSGLDDVNKLKSIFDITSIWVEEADQAEWKDIRELDRRLRGYKEGIMQIYFSFNPVSEDSYLKVRFFDARVKEYTILDENGLKTTVWLDRTITLRGKVPFEDFPYYKDVKYSDEELAKKIMVWSEETQTYNEEYYYNTIIIHSTYHDNAFMDNDYYKVMQDLKEQDEEEYNVYGLGRWGAYGGRYFSEWRKDVHVIPPFDPMGEWRKYRVLDYGLDMLACYWVTLSPDAKAYVYRELYESDLIISEAAEKIKALTPGHEKIYQTIAPPDLWNRRQDTGKSAADIFRENGVTLTKAMNDRVQGWYILKEWLRVTKSRDEQTGNDKMTSRLFVSRDCNNLIRTLPQLKKDEKNPNDVATQPHELTHGPDAIRYLLATYTAPNKQIPQDILLGRYYTESELQDMVKAKRITKAQMKKYLKVGVESWQVK